MLVRSLSFASMGCLRIDRDVAPFSYLLRFADRVVNMRLPWMYDVVVGVGDGDGDDNGVGDDDNGVGGDDDSGDDNGVGDDDDSGDDNNDNGNGNNGDDAVKSDDTNHADHSLTPQYATVMEGAPKGSLTSAHSPFLGHVLCEVTEKTIHIQRMDKEPLSAISLAADVQEDDKQSDLDSQDNANKSTSDLQDNAKQSSYPLDTTGNSPLDFLLEEMRANATDLVSRYNEQLNASANNDDHVDHSVLSRILKEYMVRFSRVLDCRRRGSLLCTR